VETHADLGRKRPELQPFSSRISGFSPLNERIRKDGQMVQNTKVTGSQSNVDRMINTFFEFVDRLLFAWIGIAVYAALSGNENLDLIREGNNFLILFFTVLFVFGVFEISKVISKVIAK
jgi:hypothetical protein